MFSPIRVNVAQHTLGRGISRALAALRCSPCLAYEEVGVVVGILHSKVCAPSNHISEHHHGVTQDRHWVRFGIWIYRVYDAPWETEKGDLFCYRVIGGRTGCCHCM